jgi:hypothetical protein
MDVNYIKSFNWSSLAKFRKYSRQDQRKLLARIHDEYHVQREMINPQLAAKELVLRVLFEVLSQRILFSVVLKGEWDNPNLRNSGHTERIERLKRCIRKSATALTFVKSIKWLNY